MLPAPTDWARAGVGLSGLLLLTLATGAAEARSGVAAVHDALVARATADRAHEIERVAVAVPLGLARG